MEAIGIEEKAQIILSEYIYIYRIYLFINQLKLEINQLTLLLICNQKKIHHI